ncbi:MAG: glutaredoxin family protein [Pseudomonadota bacterium]
MPTRFTLLTRPGCHLCEDLETEALAAFGDRIAIDTVLVDHHPAWQSQYGLRIPVLLDAQGQFVCEVQLDEAALARALG